MKRREFLAASAAAPLAVGATSTLAFGEKKCKAGKGPLFLECRHYSLKDADKQAKLEEYFAKALLPALKKRNIGPVGVLRFAEGTPAGEKVMGPLRFSGERTGDLYAILPSYSLADLLSLNTSLLGDADFMKAAKPFLGNPELDAFKNPLYERVESSLFKAFTGLPTVELPTKKKGRLFQLRVYASHNIERAAAKRKMFNEGGEIALFKKSGMPPVFFGEGLVGEDLPNLTYMLGFDDDAAMLKGWKAFLESPGWNKLKKEPQYKETVSNIENFLLKPADCSEI